MKTICGGEGKFFWAAPIPCEDCVCLNCKHNVDKDLHMPCAMLDDRPDEVVYQSAPCPAYAPDEKGITYLHDPEVKDLPQDKELREILIAKLIEDFGDEVAFVGTQAFLVGRMGRSFAMFMTTRRLSSDTTCSSPGT